MPSQRAKRKKDKKNRAKSKLKTKLTQFVRYADPENLWCPRPNDPYIYISFSTKIFYQVYGGKTGVAEGFEDFDDARIMKIKEIIQNEWINKGNLPLRYLPRNADIRDIQNKNVYCIGRGNWTVEQLRARDSNFGIITRRVRNRTGVVAMYTSFPNWSLSELNIPKYIFEFLHESMHALIEGKHFKKYDSTDREPYNDTMTCEQSVMSHLQTCPAITNQTNKFFARFPQGTTVAKMLADPSWSEYRKMHIDTAYPRQLGLVDIEAAQEFNADWAKRNAESATKQQQLNPVKPDKLTISEKAAKYLLSTGYFPQDQKGQPMTYWNRGNSSALFQSAMNNVLSANDCLPMSTISFLLGTTT